jgi:hypothetical protein
VDRTWLFNAILLLQHKNPVKPSNGTGALVQVVATALLVRTPEFIPAYKAQHTERAYINVCPPKLLDSLLISEV